MVPSPDFGDTGRGLTPNIGIAVVFLFTIGVGIVFSLVIPELVPG